MKILMRSPLPTLAPPKATLAKVAAVLRFAAKEEEVPDFCGVTVGFCDDRRIRRFNRRFRRVDAATDVLSFPLTQGREEWQALPKPPADIGMAPLGDILISTERAAAQAEAYGHGLEREICFLALHGFLHLLGYDHIKDSDRLCMEQTAERYLSSLGVRR